MDQSIKENGDITNIMAMGFTSSQMGLYMRANGRIILCMELDISLITQVVSGEVNFVKESSKVEDKASWFRKRLLC